MSASKFPDPGLLDRRAVLEENAGSPDAMGGLASAWREIAELNARLEPLSQSVRERFDRSEAHLTHRVTLRHRDGLDRGMAFRLGTRRLVIRTIHDPDETGRYLLCRCEEET